MKTRSAGIALYRIPDDREPEVFLGRFGGPYWRNKERAWGIPKGVYDPDRESPEDAAKREWTEETGLEAPEELSSLGEYPIGSGKILEAFAAEGDVDPSALDGDTFTLEWPPDSGNEQDFPEIERAAWVPLADAKEMVVESQVPVVEALADSLS